MASNNWSIIKICQEIIGDQEMCVKWCEDRGLLPTERICAEGHEMIPIPGKSCYGYFRCTKSHTNGKIECFTRTRDMTYKSCIIESSIDKTTTSKDTVAEFYAFCRELITQHLLELSNRPTQLGGENIVVEIEELVLGERKFKVGHISEGTCILAMIERDTKEFALEVCHENQWNEEDLIKLIKEHVVTGSVIIPEQWRDLYTSLITDGYIVKESSGNFANYSDVYLDEPDCPPIRRNLKKSLYKDMGVDKLLEYLYKLDVKKRNVDPFEAFLDVIRHRFPV